MGEVIVDQGARYKVVEFPTALPGHCFLCRRDTGPFIDANFSEEFFGAIYLCKHCIEEMARIFGWVLPEEKDQLKSELAEVSLALTNALVEIQALEEENGGLRIAIGRTVTSSNGAGTDSSSSGSDGVDHEDEPVDDGGDSEGSSKNNFLAGQSSD